MTPDQVIGLIARQSMQLRDAYAEELRTNPTATEENLALGSIGEAAKLLDGSANIVQIAARIEQAYDTPAAQDDHLKACSAYLIYLATLLCVAAAIMPNLERAELPPQQDLH